MHTSSIQLASKNIPHLKQPRASKRFYGSIKDTLLSNFTASSFSCPAHAMPRSASLGENATCKSLVVSRHPPRQPIVS